MVIANRLKSLHARPELQLHAAFEKRKFGKRRYIFVERRQNLACRLDQHHIQARFFEVLGDFYADKPTANDDDLISAQLRFHRMANGVDVVQIAQRQNAFIVDPSNCRTHGASPWRQ